MRSLKKTQSIFEYVLVSAVFATVGIATFFVVVSNTAINKAGTSENYYSNSTDMGKILDNGFSREELLWPSKFGEYSSDAGDYSETIKPEQIAKPPYTKGEPLWKLYKYEKLNWAIINDIEGMKDEEKE